MATNEKELKIITSDTKKSIDTLEVVTPSMYASLFSKYAISHDTPLENENRLTNDLLDEKVSIFTNLQETTSTNAKRLSESADRAITAIKQKDENILNEVLQETQKLRHELEKLKESVYKDELTHALNRKWLHDNIVNESNMFKRSGILAMIDLNYFKLVNDTYGHVIGDKVLIFISNQLKTTQEDVIRYGGDEFLIMFNESTTFDSALFQLNKIRESILTKSLKAKKDSFKVSFSFGICKFTKKDTLSGIIAKADEKMYADKIEIKKRVTGI